MISPVKTSRRQRGLGLVEVMIAMLISLFLLTAVIGVFLSNKENTILQRNLSSIQETARFAMHVLTQDIRMAGYSGCSPNVVDHLDPAGTGYSDALFNIKTAVAGWEYTKEGTAPGDTYDSSTLDPAITAAGDWKEYSATPKNLIADIYAKADGTKRVVPGTDVLVVKKLAANSDIQMDNNPNITNSTLKTKTNPTNIDSGTILMVTEDCQSADLFQKTNNGNGADITKGVSGGMSPGNVNATKIPGFSGGQKWSKLYTDAATVLIFQSHAYYIGIGASGLPALFRASYNSTTTGTHEELIDGIENMQVIYGEDTDSTPDGVANKWVTINNVSDTQKIVAVRISMLLLSPGLIQSFDADTSTYRLAGLTDATSTIINPIDEKRLRVVTTATIKLRNKGELL